MPKCGGRIYGAGSGVTLDGRSAFDFEYDNGVGPTGGVVSGGRGDNPVFARRSAAAESEWGGAVFRDRYRWLGETSVGAGCGCGVCGAEIGRSGAGDAACVGAGHRAGDAVAG